MPGHVINVSRTGEKPSAKAELAFVAKNMVWRSDGKPLMEPYTHAHVHDFWNVDPRLVDPAKGDYHLKTDSPAIAAGAEVSDVKVDLDGVARPQGKPCAIGAFEYRRKEERNESPGEEKKE
jgi:hypothetical protein